MNWTAVIKELRKQARMHADAIITAKDQPMIQQGAAITSAVLSGLAHALEKGDLASIKIETGKQ
jgi:hypothetical protein